MNLEIGRVIKSLRKNKKAISAEIAFSYVIKIRSFL